MSSTQIGILVLVIFTLFLAIVYYREQEQREACFRLCLEEKKDKWVCRIACKCSSCE